MKKKMIIAIIVMIIYICAMYTISTTQTYQKVYIEPTTNRYEMSSEESDMLHVELKIDNRSNRAVSSQLGDVLIYDIYLYNGQEYTFLGNNVLENFIGNVLPDSCQTMDVGVYVPLEEGVYKIVFDINRGQSYRLSEKGMNTYEAIVEVQ